MTIRTITTDRLRLRALTADDAEPLHRLLDEREVMRYLPRPVPPSLEQVQQLITAQIGHWRKHGYGWGAVQRLAGVGIVGWSGLQFLPETDEVEVAYCL